MPIKLKIYFVLGALFCVSLVTGNLIFQKIVVLSLGVREFEISAGAVLYPLTFLLTDLISEFYDRSYADTVVKTGILASIFVMSIIHLTSFLPAAAWSPVDKKMFNDVFGNFGLGFLSSVLAAAIAQFADIRFFKFLKYQTKGKHLWLRNNVSTIIAQTLDTAVVLSILSFFGVFPWDQLFLLFINTLVFKYIFALADTPFFYLGVYLIKKWTEKER